MLYTKLMPEGAANLAGILNCTEAEKGTVAVAASLTCSVLALEAIRLVIGNVPLADAVTFVQLVPFIECWYALPGSHPIISSLAKSTDSTVDTGLSIGSVITTGVDAEFVVVGLKRTSMTTSDALLTMLLRLTDVPVMFVQLAAPWIL